MSLKVYWPILSEKKSGYIVGWKINDNVFCVGDIIKIDEKIPEGLILLGGLEIPFNENYYLNVFYQNDDLNIKKWYF